MGIMTAITQTTWTFTCKACIIIRNLFLGALATMMAITETAGRTRAAAELTRQGYHEEAKALMLELEEIRKQ